MNHPTVAERHARRLRRANQSSEHPTYKFKVTMAGGYALHKGTLSFGPCREKVKEQARLGRPTWVRETTSSPVVILELWVRSTSDGTRIHCYHSGSILPLLPLRIPTWATQLHAEYIEHYQGEPSRG